MEQILLVDGRTRQGVMFFAKAYTCERNASVIRCSDPVVRVNLLKPTVHVMHQQFNIQQLYVLPTLY